MNLLDTVAAISTPYGKGGVAIIRISGNEAIEIAQRVFMCANGNSLCDMPSAKMTYGHIFMPHDISKTGIDDGMAVVFRAPHSFTGENTVEISCHGGILVTQKVLSAVLCAGARSAEAGEFTRRAYINGKFRLSEAEALGQLLEAKSDSQLALARCGMNGKLSDKIDGIYSKLLEVMSSIYASIDFPEEDLAEMSREEMLSEIGNIQGQIQKLAATYSTGRAVTEGIPTVICGRTNAGKSSVYNRILGHDAAIVTDVAGTTRDVLRETAIVGKTTLLLCDTAGIRNTDDVVENIGIERSMNEIKNAGLVIAVFDGAKSPTEDDEEFVKVALSQGVSSIALINKSDIVSDEKYREICKDFDKTLLVSALTGEGFETLATTIDEMFIDGSIDMNNDAVVTGVRQFAALNNALQLLDKTLIDMKNGMSLDACCVQVECAMSSLGEVDGREIGEEIVSQIFSRFCVGK